MNKQLAQSLKKKAEQIAVLYSNKDRQNNFNNETFEVDQIIPMGEHTASVIYKKNTGKRGCFFFYLIKNEWKYFVPTDSHILGMMSFNTYKLRVEEQNMGFN